MCEKDPNRDELEQLPLAELESMMPEYSAENERARRCWCGKKRLPGKVVCEEHMILDEAIIERRRQLGKAHIRRGERLRKHKAFLRQIGQEHVRSRFGNYRPMNESQESALDAAKKWLVSGGFLTLIGPPGVGKTHLAVAVYHELQRRGKDPTFVTEPELLRGWREASANHEANEYVRRFMEARILIWDDAGKGGLTEKGIEFLMTLLDYRYRHRLPTFFSTNYPLKELMEKVGWWFVSRLINGRAVKVQGDDYRLEIGRRVTG